MVKIPPMIEVKIIKPQYLNSDEPINNLFNMVINIKPKSHSENINQIFRLLDCLIFVAEKIAKFRQENDNVNSRAYFGILN